MHPGDDANARRGGVGFQADLRDGFRPRQRRLAHHPHWEFLVEVRRNLAGVLRDLVQRLLAVQLLTSGQVPDSLWCSSRSSLLCPRFVFETVVAHRVALQLALDEPAERQIVVVNAIVAFRLLRVGSVD